MVLSRRGIFAPFYIVDDDIDRFEGVTQLLDLQGIAYDRHIPLLNIVQLLMELKLVCGCVGCKDLLEVSLGFCRPFRLSNVANYVIMDT